ncbi:hypothetical protein H9Q72_009677 [Fusarium xylarioides]|uniref:Uncharacterized protein n=1 Tax=Fusarium xylarioides TaxID=221167 RepID=A0A9P7L2I1_9HYPO|nr:hypothetical protein H9Q70_008892 [Fusarium xylarioides]KAG5762234.1 hypothetical protein H9Q72_009677 [Fusarium xylarioides]KAG5780642.1 hypothetical protein H9Q73_005687 [Fusarium xylarioides]KAG5815454.1 hypothetical protein H9Q71_002758 [Fusarium xylarioides]KAG5821046.1 hypothetical protein H9Q74_008525 [Fusarium xylarioides]
MTTLSLELGHRPTGHLAPPPDYDTTEAVELSHLSPATSSTNSLPEYTALYNSENRDSASSSSTSGFCPTKQLQIETPGFALIRLPLPPQPDPIYVFNVTATGELNDAEYVSIRPTRNSGSCFLARANDPTQAALCTTTYRFGPGKPPKIRFIEGRSQNGQAEEIEISCKGVLTRSTILRTHLGTFEWRYSSRAERRTAKASVGEDVDCLLILDQVMKVALAGGKQEERRRKVGQFVRSDGLRTQGSRRSSAGNGGRLMLDLREWLDRKNEAIEMEILAVVSCISMMKKEVDRRRMHQTMAIMGGASGGP